ncbi:hypothetical protein J007_02855 [Cryptococcus neoformans]|nr:hypothetical protein J007_02855 [Cryptococcus neoformans var. grubii]OXC61653.1 hypothetical protein C358_02934 [Cryptococcus neoformans var. grubii MW-RSA852]
MGPQLRELDKRYEGELSRAFADILQAQQTVSSSQSKGNSKEVLSSQDGGLNAEELSIQGGSLLSEGKGQADLILSSRALWEPKIELSDRTTPEKLVGTNSLIISSQDIGTYPVWAWPHVDDKSFQSLRDLYLTRVSRNGITPRGEEYQPASLITDAEQSQYDGYMFDIATLQTGIYHPHSATAPAGSKPSFLSQEATEDFRCFTLQGGDIAVTCRNILAGGGEGYDVQNIAVDGTARHEHGHASGLTNDGKSFVSVTYSKKTFEPQNSVGNGCMSDIGSQPVSRSETMRLAPFRL